MWETVIATGAVTGITALAVLIVKEFWDDRREETRRRRILRDEPLNAVRSLIDLGAELIVDIQTSTLSEEDFTHILVQSNALARALQKSLISVQASDNKELALGLQRFAQSLLAALRSVQHEASIEDHETRKQLIDKWYPTLSDDLAGLQRLYQETLST